jgi:hypothetical protein
MVRCRSSRHVAPVRNDCSEGNGRSKEKKRENQGDKDFHSDTSLSIQATLWNVTDRATWETFVLDLCLAGQTNSYHHATPNSRQGTHKIRLVTHFAPLPTRVPTRITFGPVGHSTYRHQAMSPSARCTCTRSRPNVAFRLQFPISSVEGKERKIQWLQNR